MKRSKQLEVNKISMINIHEHFLSMFVGLWEVASKHQIIDDQSPI